MENTQAARLCPFYREVANLILSVLSTSDSKPDLKPGLCYLYTKHSIKNEHTLSLMKQHKHNGQFIETSLWVFSNNRHLLFGLTVPKLSIY